MAARKTYILKLYVAGNTPNSSSKKETVKKETKPKSEKSTN